MRFSIVLALVSSIGLVASNSVEVPAEVPAEAHNASLGRRSGCGSVGPLGNGHFVWYIVVPCTPGRGYTCQATDATGCLPGNAKKIGSMEVDDPDDTKQYAKQSHTNTVGFTCPGDGQVRCQANFNDNNDGPGYSLRVF